MNFDKALNILWLSRNYIEDDLKRLYKRLITKYHSNLFEKKLNEKKEVVK